MRQLEKFLVKIIAKISARLILAKSDIADIIAQRYPNICSLVKLSLNYLCFLLSLPKTFVPITAVFESTNSCNLACLVCPIRVMKRKKGFMDFGLYRRVLDANKNLSSVQLYGWGEPLLHPKIIEMIKYAKNYGLTVRIVTNGTKLTDGKARQLLDSCPDHLCISVDGAKESTYKKIRNFDYKKVETNIKNLIRLRNNLKKETFIEVSMVVFEDTESEVEAFRQKWSKIVDRVQIQPRMTYQPTRRTGKCFELWRGNPIVLWDGSVVPCCVDFEGELKVGDVKDELSLSKILNTGRMVKLRKQHIAGEFPRACRFCSEYESKKTSKRFQ